MLFKEMGANRNTQQWKDKWANGIRLARTPPAIFGPSFAEGKLSKATHTCAWAAAIRVFGGLWLTPKTPRKKTSFTPDTKTTSGPKKNPYASTPDSQIPAPNSKLPVSKTPSAKHFIAKTSGGVFVRKFGQPASNIAELPQSKYTTYFKLIFPECRHDGASGEETLVQQFNVVLNAISKTANSATLVPWEEDSKQSAMKDLDDEPITNRFFMDKFASGTWTRKGFKTYSRCKIGHHTDPDELDMERLESLNATHGIIVLRDKIQANEVTCLGWLLGAHPKCFSVDEYVMALKAHPAMKGMDIEVRMSNFRLHAREAYSEKIRVVHLYGARNSGRKVKTALNSIYGSRRQSDSFPLGRNYRFIPFTASKFKAGMDPGLVRNAQKAILAQKNFISQTVVIDTDTIAGLDTYIPKIDTSLREIIMCMKASDGQTDLFTSVDAKRKGLVGFVVHRDLEHEANAILSPLPLLIAAKFGPRAWGWFQDWVANEFSGMHWDTGAGALMSNDSDELADTLADWGGLENLEENPYDADETVTNIRIDLDMQMDIEADREQYQIFDENGSIASFGNFLSEDHEDDDDNSVTVIVDQDKDPPTTLSTMTDNESAEAIAKRFNEDPNFRIEVLNKTTDAVDLTGPSTPSPTNQNTTDESMIDDDSDL
jgi:hypothetical protein